jgi:hypothetical protein
MSLAAVQSTSVSLAGISVETTAQSATLAIGSPVIEAHVGAAASASAIDPSRVKIIPNFFE